MHAAPTAAVLAWLKRRKVMVPTLLRIIYTVSFETWTAQVRAGGEVCPPGCADAAAKASAPARCRKLPTCHPTRMQHLFFGPAKASGVSDSIVHNVAETVTALARRLEGVRRLHAA